MTPDALNPDVAALVREALAAPDGRARSPLVRRLAAAAHAADQAAAAFDALLRSGPAAATPALELLAWLPDPVPPALAPRALSALRNAEVPLALRTAVAGRLLGAVPDDPQAVTPVVQALTFGASKAATLDRLLDLERHVARCDTLGVLVETAEANTVLRCPRCDDRLTRFALIPHLWARHGLLFHDGQAVEPRGVLAATITAAAGGRDARLLDESFAAHAAYYPREDPRLVFQALASQGPPDAAEVEQLLAAADADRAGLCPVCLNAIPDPLPELPPEASCGAGRVSGEGYRVEVRDGPGGRAVGVGRPGGGHEEPARVGPRLSPRLAGVYAALPALVVGTLAAMLTPGRLMSPLAPGAVTVAVALAAYLLGRYARRPLPDATTQALTLAWSDLTPGIGRSPGAVRFLTRLCRVSLRAGDPVARSPAVYELVEHAAVLADRGPAQMQLLAAARVLQALDGASLGREKVAGLAAVFRPFVRGELPPAYGEAAAELLLGVPEGRPGELARLAVLVLADAFDAGLSASDLMTVARFLPGVRALLLGALPDHLRLLQGVHEHRGGKLWAKVGSASTVFEFAEASPTESRKLLAAHPDALLVLELDEATEAELGRVVVTARGLAVGPVVVSDPDAVVEVVKAGDGLWRLQLGASRLPLGRKPPDRLAGQLRAWLRFRAAVLMPLAERDDDRTASEAAVQVLTPLVVTCPLCQTAGVHRRGRVGTPWLAIRPPG